MKTCFFTIIFTLLLSIACGKEKEKLNSPALTLYQMVTASSNELVQTIKKTQGEKSTDTEALGKSILKLLDPIVDFTSISKSVMGKYYKLATPDQQKEFTSAFKNNMTQFYAKSLIKLDIKSIVVDQPIIGKPGRGKISMTVESSDGSSYSITYSMRKDDKDQWHIRNVIIDGINLGLTYRNQFYSAADSNKGDIDKLISNWGK